MAKKRTTLSFPEGLREEAAEYKVNMSEAAEAGIVEAVRQAKIEAWQRENKDWIKAHNKWVEENELPLARYRQF